LEDTRVQADQFVRHPNKVTWDMSLGERILRER
jgi:hypothetical protein